jgi:PTH1 family peptidyl-tRNA hydrolase
LGNPGADFENTRHNVGFAVIDALAKHLGVSYWKLAANAMVAEVSHQGEKLILVKPQSYMNLSGGPIKGLTGRYGFGAEDMLVIHDELDLPAQVLRLKQGGGHAGHNGLRSLHLSVGSDYTRLRIGIGRPPGRMPAHAFVLRQLKPDELDDFAVTVAEATEIALAAIERGVLQAMNEYHRDAGAGSGDVGADGRGVDANSVAGAGAAGGGAAGGRAGASGAGAVGASSGAGASGRAGASGAGTVGAGD